MRPFRLISTIVVVLLFENQLQAASDMDQLPVRGEWERTSVAPLSNREGASIAWNGSEIYVFGGTELLCNPSSLALCLAPSTPPFAKGAAAYNPFTNKWRPIANPPIGIIDSGIATVESDIFALVLYSYVNRSLRLLRYQSKLDIWDEFNLPENTVSARIAAFGTDIVLYKSTDEDGPATDWLLDTLEGKWVRLPDDPLGPGFSRQYVVHEDTLYLFDHALVPSPGGEDGPSYLRAAKFQNNQWSELPTADSIGSAPTLISENQLIAPELGCADGGHTNGYGRCIAFGALFDTATDTWHELPNALDRGRKDISSSGGISATGLVLYKTGYPALNAETNDWFIVPLIGSDFANDRRVWSVGNYGFVFGGASSGIDGTRRPLNDSWIWKP